MLRRNKPGETSFANEERHKREKHWYSGEAKEKPLRKCIYCELDHWSDKCKKLQTIESRNFFRENRLCFNCGKKGHKGDKCLKRGCYFCEAKQHSSLCDKEKDGNGSVLTGFTSSVEEILPLLLPAQIEGKVIWVFFDTGSGRNFISKDAMRMLTLKPERFMTRDVATINGTRHKGYANL